MKIFFFCRFPNIDWAEDAERREEGWPNQETGGYYIFGVCQLTMGVFACLAFQQIGKEVAKKLTENDVKAP